MVLCSATGANVAAAAAKRWLPLIALLLLAACLMVAVAQAEDLELASSRGETLSGSHPATSDDSEIKRKAFKFTQFKALFHKSYDSIAEESRRQALYLANLFQMFTSYLNYKLKRASSFSAINQMSDWTEGEFQESLMNPAIHLAAMRASELEYELDGAHADEDEQLGESTRTTFANLLLEDAENEDNQELADRFNQLNSGSKDNDLCPVGDSCDKKASLGERLLKKIGKSLSSGAKEGLSAVDGLIQDSFHKIYTRKPEYRPDLPDQIFVDHRELGCIARIKNQARCGSCYIFAALALYEWAYCKREGEPVEFSEQYLLDCGHNINMQGCQGGWSSEIAKFIGKYGLELSERYTTYQARENECPYESGKVPTQAMGFVRMDKPELSLVMGNNFERQLEVSPILVTIYTANKFHQYGGGIDEGVGCGKRRFQLHAVLLVGHGRKDGHEYWIIRNSHGFWFGEAGYYKVRKDSKCLADFGAGQTLKALKDLKVVNEETKKMSPHNDTEHKLMSGQTDGLVGKSNLVEKQYDVYKFYENPKYDWKLLAAKFEMAPQSPPTLPQQKKRSQLT